MQYVLFVFKSTNYLLTIINYLSIIKLFNIIRLKPNVLIIMDNAINSKLVTYSNNPIPLTGAILPHDCISIPNIYMVLND